MARIYVTSRSGTILEIDATHGRTMMEAIRDAGLDELQALCGGSCSCATCHIYVEEDWVDAIEPMSGDEDDLLDSSENRRSNSRLSCQIQVSAEFDGMRVSIAPED